MASATTLPAWIAALNPFASADVAIGAIPAGGSVRVTIPFTPQRLFATLLFLPPATSPTGASEINLLDNALFAPFLVSHVTFASPYEPVDASLPIKNLDPFAHLFISSLHNVPDRWKLKITTGNETRAGIVLNRDGREMFSVHAEPGDPRQMKPQQVKTIDVITWMDHSDSWVAVQKTPLSVVLSRHSAIEIKPYKISSASAIIRGKLSYQDIDGNQKAIRNEPVCIVVVGDDRSEQIFAAGEPGHTSTTHSDGTFTQSFKISKEVKYAVTATYGGSMAYGNCATKEALVIDPGR
jgi:hypothetical protein